MRLSVKATMAAIVVTDSCHRYCHADNSCLTRRCQAFPWAFHALGRLIETAAKARVCFTTYIHACVCVFIYIYIYMYIYIYINKIVVYIYLHKHVYM